MSREPTPMDLIDFICRTQPELDGNAAARLLMTEHVWDGIAQHWQRHKEVASVLLDLHIDLERASA